MLSAKAPSPLEHVPAVSQTGNIIAFEMIVEKFKDSSVYCNLTAWAGVIIIHSFCCCDVLIR